MEINKLQETLSDGILKAVENVKLDREKHFESNAKPQISDVKNIISSYGNKNASVTAVSGVVGMVPVVGMIASIPEIIKVTQNQINMIYDIAKAHNKEESLTKELILGVLIGSVGNSAISLITIHGGKVLTKRAGARVIQKLAQVLGKEILQKTVKSMASKYVPIIGAVAMASWSKYSTHKIGEKAVEIFSKEILIVEEEILDVEVEAITDSLFTKISILINLIKIDGVKHILEISHIKALIQDSNLSETNKSELLKNLVKEEIIKVDYSSLKNDKNESLSLIIDLIALSKKDGEFLPLEEKFIKEVAKEIDITDEELDILL